MIFISALCALATALTIAACGASGNSSDDDDDDVTTNTGAGEGGMLFDGGSGGSSLTGDPTTCEEAAAARTYTGCDFWPTVRANNVWSIFDYAVVVASTGENVIDATVTRGGPNPAPACARSERAPKRRHPKARRCRVAYRFRSHRQRLRKSI